MNHIFRHASLPWCICAGLALGTIFFALPLRAAVPDNATIADAFTLNSKDRTEGASLNGVMAEKGSAGWVTQKSVILRKDGAVTAGSSEGGVAYVPLPDGAGNVVKVEADINPSGTDWVGLALGQGLNDFFNGAQLFILLRPNGEYVVFAQGLKTQLGTGRRQPRRTGIPRRRQYRDGEHQRPGDHYESFPGGIHSHPQVRRFLFQSAPGDQGFEAWHSQGG